MSMSQNPDPAPAGVLSKWPAWCQWLLLVVSSCVAGVGLEYLGFPAAFLIGPMVLGIAAGIAGASIRPPAYLLAAAQTIVGCLIAASLMPQSLVAFAASWPLLVGAVLATLAGSSLVGWAVSRWQILPGTVGVWGAAPGAATAMVLMAGAFGADQRLVAFMQYYRVLLVTGLATIVAKFAVVGATRAPIDIFPPIEPLPFMTTLAVATVGALVGRILRLPTPFFVGPMLLGIVLNFSGAASFQLPEWLLAISFATVGWSIGLRFTRETLRHMRSALPLISVAIVGLIAFCAAIGFVLSAVAGVDPLTAYLATSPGGMDAVAIIAAGSGDVDVSFIMAMQMLRFVIVLAAGPWLARKVAVWVEGRG